jgi:DNA-binding NarL/FixJ family response regulator
VGGLPRVAVIDDHELVRDGLAALITSRLPSVATIAYCGASPEDAAEVRPDIALLDIDLGIGGTRLGEGIAALIASGAKVLLISSHEQAPDIAFGLQAGALGFVPKRLSVEDLIEAIHTVASGELYLSVDLAAILAAAPAAPDLSPRELLALRLYASGLKLTAVAHRMGISPHTAREYLDRVRAKYAQIGREARTRTELYAQAQQDGLLVDGGRD